MINKGHDSPKTGTPFIEHRSLLMAYLNIVLIFSGKSKVSNQYFYS
jgi:hypothetical protein